MIPGDTQQVYEEPSARSWVEWTPERIEIAELQAECGDLRLAAELCDRVRSDDRVAGVLPTRARGLLGLPFSFERSARRATQHSRAVRYLEADEDWWTIAPDHVLADLGAWGILLGVAVAQLVWQLAPSGRLVPSLDVWHPRGLRQGSETGSWRIRTRTQDVVLGDAGSWLLYTPGGSKRSVMQGAWRAVARWWLLKQYARSDWAVQGERAAGIRVAMPPAPKDGTATVLGTKEQRADQRQRLAEDLRRMARNGGLVLPAGWDLKVVQAAANTYQTFKDQIETANAGIAIALAGQNLTSEVQGGSYAAAQVHQAVANVLLRGDAESLSTALHDQVLVPWAAYNLAPNAAAPWPNWDTTPPEDLARTAQTWQALSGAADAWSSKLAAAGLELDVEDVLRRADIPTRPIAAKPASTTP